MKKNLKQSHQPLPEPENETVEFSVDHLPTKQEFKLSINEIIEVVKRRYISAYEKYHSYDNPTGGSVDITLPFKNNVINDLCRRKITELFLSLGFGYEDIDLNFDHTDQKFHIKLNIVS